MEAQIQATDGGLVPASGGWFVLNAREARWMTGEFGSFTPFEGEQRFASVGVNIGVLEPGQTSCYYHGEDEQEDFLVLAGSCLLLVEDQERPLRQWDFVHCPAWTEHVFVGAGDGPCAVLAIGTRLTDGVVYPASDVARRHNAGVAVQTRDPDVAYEGLPGDTASTYRLGWLPA